MTLKELIIELEALRDNYKTGDWPVYKTLDGKRVSIEKPAMRQYQQKPGETDKSIEL